jgi:phenylalanyl-tRNA synthetase beta chain
MNVSYLWLKELVPTDLGIQEVAQTLTRVGLNVDNITDLDGGDACLLVEVTSNRPDCLGHIGVARELAAALGVPMKMPDLALAESAEAAESLTRVEIAELDLCPLYTARVIRGVKVGPSPAWLTRRLEAIGIRPVNNIADVTNYVMMECGQPLHAFDYDRLAEHRIVVRRAVAGERFVAIDHSEHTLSPDRLVIADARRPVALAGVMGGADTEISAGTCNVLLEAAVFDPMNIRASARALALFSESSYRLERRVDPCGTDWASRRACQLMVQVAGGQVARGVAAAGKPLPKPEELALRVARLKTLLGMEIPAQAAADILARLQCEVLTNGASPATGTPDGRVPLAACPPVPSARNTGGQAASGTHAAETLHVRVPSWRADLEREVDLIEEVARHYGYEKIPERAEIRLSSLAVPTKTERVRELVSRTLTAAGYYEAVTFSFTTRDHAVRLRRGDITAEPMACRGTPLALRQALASGVVESLAVNARGGQGGARLFEIAKRFVPVAGKELPQEDAMLALAGGEDFEATRGVLEEIFAALRVGDRIRFAVTDRYPDLDPGASAEVQLDGQPLGVIGRLTAEAAKAFDLDAAPFVAEVNYAKLVEAANLRPTFRPLPQFPAMERDLALVVDEAVTWEQIAAAVASAQVAELESTAPLSVYRGKQIPAGKKSVALSLVLRSPSGTLTGDQADAMTAKILAAVKTLGAELRA